MGDVRFHHQDPEMKGWLYKWTNYLKGYQKRWFVLSNGLLSYYRNQAEMAHTCRGTISLVSAVIHTEDSCNFVISNGGTQTFHLRAGSEVERQKWVTALELAKARAIRVLDSEDDEDFSGRDINSDKQELQCMLKSVIAKLDDLRTCHELMVRHGGSLQRSLTELEQLENPAEALARSKSVNERATLFRITSNAMLNACSEYLTLAQTHGKKWQKLLQHEHDTRLRLEEMVEQLAKQHSHLEQRAIQEAGFTSAKANSPNSEDEEFYDAEESATDFFVSFPGNARRVNSVRKTPSKDTELDPNSITTTVRDGNVSSGSEGGSDTEGESHNVAVKRDSHNVAVKRDSANRKSHPRLQKSHKRESSSASDGDFSTPAISHSLDLPETGFKRGGRVRRTTIPERPNQSLNLWSFMKNCIGKELTKIPMPVNFNEPLSMLQRVTEDFEYADLLHKAAKMKDPCEQLTYIAAFCVSHYATTSVRTGKPFNPLLGETFECDRTEDLGWKSIAEQVSHHPPMLAMHAEGRGWTCWSEFSISSKFRGKYLQVTPLDISHLQFEESGYHFTWRKVTTTVHNIIVGKLWIDNHGEMTIVNHVTEDKCHLKFIPYSYFSRDAPRKVTGVVVDKNGSAKWVLQGSWDGKIEASRVVNGSSSSLKSKSVLETSTPKTLWKKNHPLPESEKMYNMTLLAIQLNEMEDSISPTDSRNRPDQRLMEAGHWDEANKVKSMLEEKQRLVRRKREEEAEAAAAAGRPYVPYEPLWFEKKKDPITGNPVHVYKNEYWSCKSSQEWSRCPSIFDVSDVLPSSPSST